MSHEKRSSIAILGMSPWNSYFKADTISSLIEEVQERFEWFRIMIPDHPAEYTYRAKWELKYKAKARLKWNAIKNKVDALLGDNPKNTLNWKEEINTHPAYFREIKWVIKLYRSNEAFKLAMESATREVLQGWGVDKEISEQQIKIGVKFLISELAFLSAAKEIIGGDVTYIYHRPWPIFTDFIAWKFDGVTRPIDFEIIAPKL